MNTNTLTQQFWDRVNKTDDCWLWTGAKTTKGFGRFKTEDGFRTPHRLTYEAFVGPVPTATPLTQTCENKLCVNPDHLGLKSEVVGDWSSRFWEKVIKTNYCWIWDCYKDDRDYGRFNIKGVPHLAHRLSYTELVGKIPDGMGLDHRCHNHSCVNPAHLSPTTQKQNVEHQSGPSKNNKSGVLGVSWSKSMNKWMARVTHNKVVHTVGYFTDIKEAEAAVKSKRLELFTHNDKDRV